MNDPQVASDLREWLKQFEEETRKFLRDIPEVRASVSHLTAATERMALAFERLDDRDRDAVPLKTHYATVLLVASPCVLFCFAALVLVLYVTNRDLTLTATGLELKTVVQEQHERTQMVIRARQDEIENRITDVLKNEVGIQEPIEVEIVGDERANGGKNNNQPVGKAGVQNASPR